MPLAKNATATDAIDYLAENVMALVQDARAGMTKAEFVGIFCQVFAEALPVFITNVAAERPELAEQLTAQFLDEQERREAAAQPRRRTLVEKLDARRAAERQAAAQGVPVVPWSEQFEQALAAVYAPEDLETLLHAESVSTTLSAVLGRRCRDTGENPADVLARIPQHDLAWALDADAPGAYLATRVREVPEP